MLETPTWAFAVELQRSAQARLVPAALLLSTTTTTVAFLLTAANRNDLENVQCLSKQ